MHHLTRYIGVWALLISGSVWADSGAVDAGTGQALWELVEPTGRVSEAELRQMIAGLDALTPPQRHEMLPRLLTAIAAVPDVQIQGQLSQVLDETLAQLGPSAVAQPNEEDLLAAVPGAAEERQTFETLLQQRQAPIPSEAEIAKQIAALTLDPEHPEIGLTQGMDIAGIIDRMEDAERQARLRKVLEDRLIELQADL